MGSEMCIRDRYIYGRVARKIKFYNHVKLLSVKRGDLCFACIIYSNTDKTRSQENRVRIIIGMR